MERGVIACYNANAGYGFLRSVDDDAKAADVQTELNNIHFSITDCDVQTPPPRVGERVLFTKRDSSKRPIVTALYRMELNVEATAPVSIRQSVVSHATNSPPKQRHIAANSPPKPRTAEPTAPARRSSERRHDPPDATSNAINRAVDAKRKLLDASPSSYIGGAMPRSVYVDLDNIWVSYVRAEHLVGLFPGAQTTRDLELDLEGFTRRLAQGERGSSVTRLVAFYYNTPDKIADKLRTMSFDGVGWDVRKQETTSDTSMQLELLNAKRPCVAHPKTLVLVTGDGNIAPNGMCFREIMDLYLRDGWLVEVHAWLFTMAKSYIEYQREYPKNVVIRPFDDDEVGEILRSRRSQGKKNKRNGGGAGAGGAGAAVVEPERIVGSRDEGGVFSRERFTDALMEAVEEVRLSTRTERHPAERVPTAEADADLYGEPHAIRKPHAVVTYRPEQYAEVIRQLEGRDGALYVPTGLAMLAQSDGSQVDLHAIQNTDVETQCLLITMALNDLMDTATMRQLQAEHEREQQAPVQW